MGLPNPVLLNSSGGTFQITELAEGQSTPRALIYTVAVGGATAGATEIPVVITAPVGVTLASTTIANGTYILVGTGANTQLVIVDGDQPATTTSLDVEPLDKNIAAAVVFNSYAGAIPVIGLEGASKQYQRTSNDVVLLASDGWTSRSYSTGTFQFSGTLYVPVNAGLAIAARLVTKALEEQIYLYVERFAANGDYSAGLCLVTDASDTFNQAALVSVNVTFSGSGVPVSAYIPAV